MSQFKKSISIFSRSILRDLSFKMKREAAIINKIQQKFYCGLCQGKGYIGCLSCQDGCKKCSYNKFTPCSKCFGVGFVSYTYF